MDAVLERDKELEIITIIHDPQYNNVIESIKLVKEFIITKKLILYGGSAIDYALRLKGDKIYPDDMTLVPDLDFMSPDSVGDAYELANILYFAGFTNVRVINAFHVETMRVDIGDNHFIADITYRPPEIFAKLPYLEYAGMRIIHPNVQRADVHFSLSFPYIGSPREVIFNRWKKDITRFNKLANKYPITSDVEVMPLKNLTVLAPKNVILHGFSAYALITHEFVRLCKLVGIQSKYSPSYFTYKNGAITFGANENNVEFISKNIDKHKSRIVGATTMRRFEPYINLVPERIEILSAGVNYCLYSTKNMMLTINSIKIDDKNIRVANIQYLLLFFLSMHIITNNPIYLPRYLVLLDMISILSPHLTNEEVHNSIFFPSINIYGDNNMDVATEITLNKINNDINGSPVYKLPSPYYPMNTNGQAPPKFDYFGVSFFRESGREIYND